MNSIFFNFLIPAIATIILLSLIYYLRSKPNSSPKKNYPPEAAGAWPIIGHLPLLGGSQPPHITLGKLADMYGPIFTIRMGVHRALVVSSAEIAKECFTKHDKIFANRPKAVAAVEHMAYNYAMFVFSSYGSYWKQIRRIVMLELLSNQRLQGLVYIRESEARIGIKEVHNKWLKNNGVLIDMKKLFSDITLNGAMRTVVGKRCGESGDRCGEAIKEFFRLTGVFVAGDAIPILKWLDLGGYEGEMKKTAIDLDEILEEFLDEHKRKRLLGDDGGGEEDSKQDFMGVMLSFLDGAQDISGYDVDTVTKATCLALLIGATNTSIVTLTWALASLLNNRDVLNKVQQELDESIGRQRQVNEQDIKSLVYLRAVIKETFRLYPAVPLLLPHESSEDCTVAGYHIPARTRLMVNASKLQRDPELWESPNEFRPERFLTTHKDIDVRGKSFEVIPFGAGRRICVGMSYGLLNVELILATLLHSFEISTMMDEPIDLRETSGLSNVLESDVNVLVTPRLDSECYY